MHTPPVGPSSARPTRVLCVDDNPDIIMVLRMVIDTDETMRCVGGLESADRLLQEVRRLNPPPDVVLLDAIMRGASPLAVMAQMAAEFPAIRTVFYTGNTDPEFIDRAITAGAWGCVSKSEDPDTILRAVRAVAAGSTWWPQLPPRS